MLLSSICRNASKAISPERFQQSAVWTVWAAQWCRKTKSLAHIKLQNTVLSRLCFLLLVIVHFCFDLFPPIPSMSTQATAAWDTMMKKTSFLTVNVTACDSSRHFKNMSRWIKLQFLHVPSGVSQLLHALFSVSWGTAASGGQLRKWHFVFDSDTNF